MSSFQYPDSLHELNRAKATGFASTVHIAGKR